MDVKDLEGKWSSVKSGSFVQDGILIHENEITFRTRDNRIGAITDKTVRFDLQENTGLVADCDCCSLKLEAGDYIKPDFYCHKENVNGRDILIISQMTMEYDGRGLIVAGTFVREQDSSFLENGFESRLYKAYNKQNAPVIMNPNAVEGGLMGFMMMQNLCAMPSQQKEVTGEAWNCTCGKQGNTGNFCAECGAKKPQ